MPLASASPAIPSGESRTTHLLVDVPLALSRPNDALAAVLRCLDGWSQGAVEAAQITQISGAMTNLVFKVHSGSAAPTGPSTVLLRVFGHGAALFSRQQERGIFLAASCMGIGPRCLLEFGNGRIEEFLPGDVLTAASMRQPPIVAAIAAAVASFHITMYASLPLVRRFSGAGDRVQGSSPRADVGGTKSALWERLHGWLDAVQQLAPEEAAALGLGAAVHAEVERMEAACERKWGRAPLLCWCHNDLQYGNVLLQPAAAQANGAAQATQATVRLIDYEYATMGDAAFDVANHFCEYAANYHAGDGESLLDWSRLPTAEQQLHFCRVYAAAVLVNFPSSSLAAALRRRAPANGNGAAPASVGGSLTAGTQGEAVETAARELQGRAVACMPLSHLKWGLWGALQAHLSDVGFDYAGYAAQRLQQYHVTKHSLLG